MKNGWPLSTESDLATKRSASDVRIDKIRTLHEGFNRLYEVDFSIKTYAGDWLGPLNREVLERQDAVVVLPIDLVRQCVVMVEQVRFGAVLAGRAYRQLEPVAGLVEKGESYEASASREIAEECGARLLSLAYVGSFLVSPGCMTESCHLYAAAVDSSSIRPLGGEAHEGEDIRVHLLSFEEVEKGIRDGRFGVAIAIVALQWLLLNRNQLDAIFVP